MIIKTFFLFVLISLITFSMSGQKNKMLSGSENFRLDSVIVRKLDTSDTWKKDTKYTYLYLYDEYNNNILKYTYNWSKDDQEWNYYFKEEKTFDEDGHKIKWILYWYSSWDSTITWQKKEMKEYSYNEQGNRIETVKYEWNSNSERWVPASKVDKLYNEMELPEQIIQHTWSQENIEWNKSKLFEYNYSNEGNKIAVDNFYWSSDSAKWIMYRKNRDYSYDGNDNLLGYIRYEWVADSSKWKKRNKYEYSYDENNRQIVKLVFYWPWQMGYHEWAKCYKEKRTYDENGYLSQKTQYSQYSLIFEEWIHVKKLDYFYSSNPMSIKKINKNLKIYPNPASDFIILDLPKTNKPVTIKIYSVGGKLRFRKECLNRRIYVGHLSDGIYIYRINYNQKVFTGKLFIH